VREFLTLVFIFVVLILSITSVQKYTEITRVHDLLLFSVAQEIFSLSTERIARSTLHLKAVLRIRIHRIHMFLGLTYPDPLVRGRDRDPDPALDPDPSIIMKNSKKNLDSYYFVTYSFLLFIFEK
jgi:hypothetical protein